MVRIARQGRKWNHKVRIAQFSLNHPQTPSGQRKTKQERMADQAVAVSLTRFLHRKEHFEALFSGGTLPKIPVSVQRTVRDATSWTSSGQFSLTQPPYGRQDLFGLRFATHPSPWVPYITRGGWYPKAGDDMPDIETNPGPFAAEMVQVAILPASLILYDHLPSQEWLTSKLPDFSFRSEASLYATRKLGEVFFDDELALDEYVPPSWHDTWYYMVDLVNPMSYTTPPPGVLDELVDFVSLGRYTRPEPTLLQTAAAFVSDTALAHYPEIARNFRQNTSLYSRAKFSLVNHHSVYWWKTCPAAYMGVEGSGKADRCARRLETSNHFLDPSPLDLFIFFAAIVLTLSLCLILKYCRDPPRLTLPDMSLAYTYHPTASEHILIGPDQVATRISKMDRTSLYPRPGPLAIVREPDSLNRYIAVWRNSNTIRFKYLNEPDFYELPSTIFNTIATQFHKATIVSLPSMSRTLSDLLHETPLSLMNMASVLVSMLGGEKGSRETAFFTQPVIWKNTCELLEEPKPMPVSIEALSVVSCPNVYPARGASSSLAAVYYRLYKVNPVRVALPRDTDGLVRSFAAMMIVNGQQLLMPWDDNAVINNQKTRITRERMARASYTHFYYQSIPEVKAFIKNEPYCTCKDLRNISAICPEHNLLGFRYGLSYKTSILYQCYWYGPGKNPTELIEAMEYVIGADEPPGFIRLNMSEGDYSRYDGTQTENVRRIPFRIMGRCFAPQFRKNFWELIDAHFQTIAKTSEGVPYAHFGSMLSGAWCTTDANTVLNIYTRFAALVRLGMTPEQAIRRVGIGFGDDFWGYNWGRIDVINGVQTMVTADQLHVQVAEELGLKLELIDVGTTYFSFLSRYYEVSAGHVRHSCPDLCRLIGKFQSMAREAATRKDWIGKYSSLLLLCGRDTPIISSYILKWFQLHKEVPLSFDQLVETDNALELPYWITQIERLTPFLDPSPELISHVLDLCAKTYKVDGASLLALDGELSRATTVEQLNSLYLQVETDIPTTKFRLLGAIDEAIIPVTLVKPDGNALSTAITRAGFPVVGQ